MTKRKAEVEVEAVSEDEPEMSSSEEEGSEVEEEDTAAGFKVRTCICLCAWGRPCRLCDSLDPTPTIKQSKGKGKAVELEQPKRGRVRDSVWLCVCTRGLSLEGPPFPPCMN